MNVSAASTFSRLASLIGATNFFADPSQVAEYAIGEIAPAVVARPATAGEVSEIVRFAGAEKLAIIPSGARTKLSMGSPPQRYDIALDLSRLDRIIAYDPADMTLAVEPGVTLATLARSLGEHGQFLPFGAPFASRATVGGTIASGVDGPMRQFYGATRDFLLGAEFVTGDGVAGKSGGLVVKNVTGYDLHKPLIGSLGTLAVITRSNLRTFPAPHEMRGFVAQFPSAESAAALRLAVAKSFLRPLTFEILSPGVAELFAGASASKIEPNALPKNLLANKSWAVATSFAADGAVLARCQGDLGQLADRSGATSFSVLGAAQDRAAMAAMFGRVREFIPLALNSSPAATILKISVPPAHLEHALCSIKHAADEHSLAWAAIARGVAVVYVALLPPERNEQSLARVTSAAKRLAADIASLDGHTTVPFAPSEWKSRLDAWNARRDDFALMQKLKFVFDPCRILAPGRFAGGI